MFRNPGVGRSIGKRLNKSRISKEKISNKSNKINRKVYTPSIYEEDDICKFCWEKKPWRERKVFHLLVES